MAYLLKDCLAQARRAPLTAEDPESTADSTQAAQVVDLFVMLMQTRDRESVGKGERKLFYQMLLHLHRTFPRTTRELLQYIPSFGYWKDVNQLLVSIDKSGNEETLLLREALKAMLRERLLQDKQALETQAKGHISLCAKWAPREGSAFHEIAKEMALLMFPDKHKYMARKLYRQLLAALNKQLNTVEVTLCALPSQWATLNPAHIPAKCLKTHSQAFLMRSKAAGKRKWAEDWPGGLDQFSDRKFCAEKFDEFAKLAVKDRRRARLHGAKLMPHEMVKVYLGPRGYEEEPEPILEAQWVDLRESLLEEMTQQTKDEEAPISLGRMIPLVDVSGSMQGEPMEVAIALGILVSELTMPEFRDRVITFESSPRWFNLEQGASLFDKVTALSMAPWEGSTDLLKAVNLILQVAVENHLEPAALEGITLVVLSDMQFDQATQPDPWYNPNHCQTMTWQLCHEAIEKSFKSAGLASKHKAPYPAPRIIFWNLRGGTGNLPAAAQTPGVQMLSGFSANMLKLFMKGEPQEDAVAKNEHSYALMREALDNHRYDVVRKACAFVKEKEMETYSWTPPEGDLKEQSSADGFVLV